MWFKNLIVYRLPAGWSLSAAELEARLERHAPQPCSPFEMLSRGWVTPTQGARLVHTVNQQHMIALGVNQKLLPASIVRQEAATRAQALAESQGFPVGRRQMRELKMRVTEELRARALTRRRTTRAWVDPAGSWCVVDAASAGKAEEVIEALRDALDRFPVQLLDTRRAPQASMADWLAQGEAPGHFTIDQDLELQSADRSKSLIRYTRHPLEGAEIRAHLSAGKHPTRLGLTWNDRIAFVLTDKLQVKRVEFLEMTRDAVDETEVDPAEQFDIDFTVMCGELGKLIGDLVQSLGGESESQLQAAAA
jgi:recombination associated protein RdgC